MSLGIFGANLLGNLLANRKIIQANGGTIGTDLHF